ncbi:hypothetical protein OQY15_22325 [Pedobacter sp. MC2016-15]|uniref:hypothetical protein n=1 Tax=Pedobacter sp. MC2016-15 TaxID=2994473 RepID=UPI0022466420|nr:hypothetical protein [Pedobacter sp. MC2016-15]MCX2481853.1 hypothetical protein [Pedobacter sp. MC2016-15]
MFQKRFLLCFVINILIITNIQGQTSGLGEVRTIESMAISFDNNQTKITQYRAELPELESLWRNKIHKANEELAALYKERDALIADMKIGARCSQCSKYKSEFEKEGKNFAQHLGEVKGYAIPATTIELETTRKQFAEKIAIKKVFLQSLKNGDNAVVKKQNSIRELENTNNMLCKEITAHSKEYERIILSEATAKQDDWISSLMELAINILISDDKVTIYKSKVLRLQVTHQKEIVSLKERLRVSHLEAQNENKNRVSSILQKISNINVEKNNYLAPLEIQLNKAREQKNAIENELKNTSVTDSVKLSLSSSLNGQILQIANLEKSILVYNASLKNRIALLEAEVRILRENLINLNTSLPKLMVAELAKFSAVYEQKKIEAKQLISSSTVELANARKTYTAKAELSKKKNLAYVDQVVIESNRIVVAAQKITCPVWNDSRFKVVGNWNKLFSCVNSLTTMAKPFSYNVFNAYCPGKSAASYMASYKKFLISLNVEDKKAVMGNSNVNWFETITL